MIEIGNFLAQHTWISRFVNDDSQWQPMTANDNNIDNIDDDDDDIDAIMVGHDGNMLCFNDSIFIDFISLFIFSVSFFASIVIQPWMRHQHHHVVEYCWFSLLLILLFSPFHRSIPFIGRGRRGTFIDSFSKTKISLFSIISNWKSNSKVTSSKQPNKQKIPWNTLSCTRFQESIQMWLLGANGALPKHRQNMAKHQSLKPETTSTTLNTRKVSGRGNSLDAYALRLRSYAMRTW